MTHKSNKTVKQHENLKPLVKRVREYFQNEGLDKEEPVLNYFEELATKEIALSQNDFYAKGDKIGFLEYKSPTTNHTFQTLELSDGGLLPEHERI